MASFGVADQALPGDTDGRVEERDVDAFLIHDAQPRGGVVAARRASVFVAALSDRHQIGRVHADAAERTEPAAQRQMRPAVDQQHLDALGVALDANRPLAQLGLEVALPHVARFENVAVGVDDRNLRFGSCVHVYGVARDAGTSHSSRQCAPNCSAPALISAASAGRMNPPDTPRSVAALTAST